MEVVKIEKTLQKDNYKKLRVCAYARVSTDMEEQQSSFESQVIYYENKIKNNPNWIFVDVYADKGVSGTSTKGRDSFNRMVRDGLNGKFDLILTKSISRFARNTLDFLETIRKLKSNNVYIFFEEDMISTDMLESELIITSIASVAQMESELSSERIFRGAQMRRELNTPLIFQKYYGYKIKKDKMIINKKEAKIVIEIFNRYLNNEEVRDITNDLIRRKVPCSTGYGKWNTKIVKRILKNRVYLGEFRQRSRKNLISSINDGKWEEYNFIDHHEPIIDKDIFEKVNNMMEKRRLKYLENRKIPDCGKKIFCGFCNRKCTGKKVLSKNEWYTWKCRNNFRCGNYDCIESVSIPDEIIKKSFVYLLKKISNMNHLDKYNKEYNILNNQINREMQKYNNLLNDYLNKKITNYIYDAKRKKYEIELNNMRSELNQMNKIMEDNITMYELFKYINELLKYYCFNEYNDDLFNLLIKKVKLGGYSKKGYKDRFMIRFIINSEYINYSYNTQDYIYETKFKFTHQFNEKNLGRKLKKSFNIRLEIEQDMR